MDDHRILRFLLAGGVNTIVGYALFYLALAIFSTTLETLVVSTILAVLFNFTTTGSFVFRSRDPRRLPRFFGVYTLVFGYNLSYSLNRLFVFGARA